ncbi:hypothetical protein FN846DRAFT_930152 [Sphaerosporella brunnea]|uniref:Uncharacterized protein n=1 Tax=Sphaerosporella brunnea TaxID=1250544 RepID=A0A5J5F7R1_9PEZI|nr:hypothetical protein FN846DRAFT_930152 [Sphaerosporella brunnea]
MPAIKPARPAPQKATQRHLHLQTLRHSRTSPHPEKALSYLERLRSDPGIKRVMAKYKDTDMHSKTLGRNTAADSSSRSACARRLRGYRDYKTVRKTIAMSWPTTTFWDSVWKAWRRRLRRTRKSGGRTRLTNHVFYEDAVRRNTAVADEGAVGCLGVQRLNPYLDRACWDAVAARREMMARAAEERHRDWLGVN